MSERTKIVETETSGEYGEQVVVHGKTAGGVYKPIYIGDDGKVKIDPVPPDVDEIADEVESRILCVKVSTPYPKVYPLLSDVIVVTAGAGVWLEGSYIDIVPINTITTPFWIYGVLFVGSSDARYPLLTLATGSAGSEIPFAHFTKLAFYEASTNLIPCPILKVANTQIRAKVADNNAIATTYGVKLLYMTGL